MALSPEWQGKMGETVRRFGITGIRKAFKNKDCNTSHCVHLNNTVFFEVSDGQKWRYLQKELMSSGMLEWAEPVPVAQLAYTPNDPQISSQVYLSLIQAYTAWDINKGGASVIIGMIDSGTDTLHEDLLSNYFLNTSDPYNGIDDDGDGYTDNYRGWNFTLSNHRVNSTANDHGVQMSGAASAVTDNSKGIASVGFNTRLLPVKVTDGSEVKFGFEGIKYAADRGCKVINCSWNYPQYSRYAEEIVNYATYEKDALVVAAAGNQGADAPNYPAAYESVLGVANTDLSDLLASNSNFGYYISISAPGVNILTTKTGNQYGTNSGTSLSTAIVTGAAALLRANFPAEKAPAIHARLKATSDNVYNVGSNSQKMNKMGAGRLNVYRAISAVQPVWADVIQNTAHDKNNGIFEAGDTLRFDLDWANRLGAIAGGQLYIVSSSNYLQVVSSQTPFPLLSVGDTAQLRDVFEVSVGSGAPLNHVAPMYYLLVAGSDTMRHGFDIVLNPTYYNFSFNDISSTLGSRGTFGYFEYPQNFGQGVRYKGGDPLLYEGGLLIGQAKTGDNRVVDRMRGQFDMERPDFLATAGLSAYQTPDSLIITGQFDDSGAPSNDVIGLRINQRLKAYHAAAHTGYFVLEYGISHRLATEVEGIYAGLLADWDLGDYEKNHALYDGQRYLAYTYPAVSGGLWCGIQLIRGAADWKCYSVDHTPGGAGGIDLTDNDIFSKVEKFTSLTTTREKAGQQPEGGDVLQILSTGPHRIPAGDTLWLSWAVHVANNQTSLFESADSAFFRALGTLPTGISPRDDISLSIYPNPASDLLHISAETPPRYLTLRDLRGLEVICHPVSSRQTILYLKSLSVGTYILEANYQDRIVYRLVVINH